MAMTDRRPLGIPVTSTHASPTFNSPPGLNKAADKSLDKSADQSQDKSMKPTISDLKGSTENDIVSSYTSDKSASPMELSPTSRSISPDSLMNSGSIALKKTTSSVSSRDSSPPQGSQGHGNFYSKTVLSNSLLSKKPKPTARVPIATGISTTIPVTGDKPKPEQEGDASLEDDVLHAIFLILYEKDPEGAGMTVKQICDVLVERHPEMAQLSSKTSNLVSAKLNAYVKRVEKGDSNLKYALSREWADASPKRMVYVYRGLLAKDFHVHVKNAMEVQKQQSDHSSAGSSLSSNFEAANDSFEAAKQSALSKPRRQTMFDLGVSRHAFSSSGENSHLFVPYSSAPVAANLTKSSQEKDDDAENNTEVTTMGDTSRTGKGRIQIGKKFDNDSDSDFEDFGVFIDSDDDATDFVDITNKLGKRSKSMSHLSANKKAKFVTAAAAAPRVPKTPCSHSPHAAAAAAALHAAALKAIAAAIAPSDNGVAKDSVKLSPKSKSKWAHAVRSGFLTQEIGAPEDVSLSDLDRLFK